ncbi:MAG: phosphoglucosamine mutase [Clostridiaceae bacterium]|jgi:phosphoglucosamine mutase|nr:phosphoglucosamine mutase [Clostridiaceae bacterium]
MSRLFGTDGVRGVANKDLTPDLAYRLGYAAAYILTDRHMGRPRVLVGEDTRVSRGMLASALVAGLCSAGADAIECGIVPTPAVAWLIRHFSADAGVVISASHNSFEFNGIKLFGGDGYKLADETEDLIEAHVRKYREKDHSRPYGEDVGRRIEAFEAADLYREHLEDISGLDLSGMRLGLDCANGASYEIAPRLFRDLNAEVHAIGVEPDGYNINRECGSMHLDKLIALVKEKKLDLGFAFDGDADRVLAVDSDGYVCDGDIIMTILALVLKKEGKLIEDTLVTTVMSNFGLNQMAEKYGIVLERTQVGDRYVMERMREGDFNLGGEQSGHIILREHSTTGDGILSALQLLKALNSEGQSLEEARQAVKICPQVLKNAHVSSESAKKRIMGHSKLSKKIKEIESVLGKDGRVLVRSSGTEPLVRVMLEGNDTDEINGYADELLDLVYFLDKDNRGN